MMGRLMVGVLATAVVGSALGVVYSKHESRKQFLALQELDHEGVELEIEWGKLQLEQSTWATDSWIEEQASSRLGMRLPRPESVVVIKP